MNRYNEPQVCVINNSSIAKKIGEKYIVVEGDLGSLKEIKYGRNENERFLNWEFKKIPNLHEYEVRIIDMQEEQTKVLVTQNENPSGEYLLRVSYPKTVFDPRPLALHHIKEDTDEGNLTIFFADSNIMGEYEIVKVVGQNSCIPYYDKKHGSNEFLSVGSENKQGQKLQCGNHKLSETINKYATGYRVIFELPGQYNRESNAYVRSKSYMPLLTNQVGEVVSYIGISSKKGYELVLPVCKNKEQLIEELFSCGLSELMPEIFPESQEFVWSNSDYYKSREILQLEESIKEIEKDYQVQVKKAEDQIHQIKESKMFLTELLIESGDKLVAAVAKYFEWLGFSNVLLVDEKETGILREDIQIVLKEGLLIVEVKGIGGTSTDSECAQIAKHRRRRENEYPEKKIFPIYIVNHQRYVDPRQRKTPPFSKDQIDYAYNDERGLLTTWDMYKSYKYIEDGVFTKEEVKDAFYKHGLLDLIPVDMRTVGKVNKYYPKTKACIVELDNVKVCVGDEIICKKGDICLKAKVESLQEQNSSVDSAQHGEIGLVLDIELEKGYILYKRENESGS